MSAFVLIFMAALAVFTNCGVSARSSDNEGYVHTRFFNTTNCSEENYQVYVDPVGVCQVVAGTSSRWTCNSGVPKVENWGGNSLCSGTPTGVLEFSPGLCYEVSGVSQTITCENDAWPQGSWYATINYLDSKCVSFNYATMIKNHYCNPSKTDSTRIDYPIKYIYYDNIYCNGTSKSGTDLSLYDNKCKSTTGGQSMFVKLIETA